MSNEDPFADVRGDLGNFGILGGDAVQDQFSANAKSGAEGTTYSMRCQSCGTTHQVTVTWEEMMFAAAKKIPPNWKYDKIHGAFTPDAGCRVCRAWLPLMITPDECIRYLKAAEQSGRLSPQAINGLKAMVMRR